MKTEVQLSFKAEDFLLEVQKETGLSIAALLNILASEAATDANLTRRITDIALTKRNAPYGSNKRQ